MPNDVAPLFAGDKKAAALLDMKPAEFRSSVNDGVLPTPIDIGGFERWDVEQLKAIARGDGLDGGPIQW